MLDDLTLVHELPSTESMLVDQIDSSDYGLDDGQFSYQNNEEVLAPSNLITKLM